MQLGVGRIFGTEERAGGPALGAENAVTEVVGVLRPAEVVRVLGDASSPELAWSSRGLHCCLFSTADIRLHVEGCVCSWSTGTRRVVGWTKGRWALLAEILQNRRWNFFGGVGRARGLGGLDGPVGSFCPKAAARLASRTHNKQQHCNTSKPPRWKAYRVDWDIIHKSSRDPVQI